MTEVQWLSCNDPDAMLHFLQASGHLSARKAQLFAVAVCRRIWHLLPDDRSRRAVEIAERYADGEASRKELAAAQAAIRGIRSDTARRAAGTAAASAARHAAGVQRYYSTSNGAADARWAAARAATGPGRTGRASNSAAWAAAEAEGANQAALLRDIVGPLPFRPLPALPAATLGWNDGCVGKLAAGLYQERDFSPGRLSLLADALEEAGCRDTAILEHLRGSGPHARGCFVLDSLLGHR
jgi:hypothetical protein